jgi:GxxExxY protein
MNREDIEMNAEDAEMNAEHTKMSAEHAEMNEPQRHRGSEGAEREVTSSIIGAAIEVHRVLGPGLLEPLYERALCIELDYRGVQFERQVRLPAYYRGRLLGEYRIDLIVRSAVIVEIKSVVDLAPVFEAQMLTYLRLTGKHVGLLINFNSRLLKSGIRRFVL